MGMPNLYMREMPLLIIRRYSLLVLLCCYMFHSSDVCYTSIRVLHGSYESEILICSHILIIAII
jgi:hypothetical protein